MQKLLIHLYSLLYYIIFTYIVYYKHKSTKIETKKNRSCSFKKQTEFQYIPKREKGNTFLVSF